VLLIDLALVVAAVAVDVVEVVVAFDKDGGGVDDVTVLQNCTLADGCSRLLKIENEISMYTGFRC
jgi:hypothetical protein